MPTLLENIVSYEPGIFKNIKSHLRLDDEVNLLIVFPSFSELIINPKFKKVLNSSVSLKKDSFFYENCSKHDQKILMGSFSEEFYQYNALIYAIINYKNKDTDLELIEKVLELGADPNLGHSDICYGVSPMCLSVQLNKASIVEILLDYDADPELPSNWVERIDRVPVSRYNFQECYTCVTPLTVAVYSENLEILDMLLSSSSDLKSSLFTSTEDNFKDMLGEARFSAQRVHEYFRTETVLSIAIGRSGLSRVVKSKEKMKKLSQGPLKVLDRLKQEVGLLEMSGRLCEELVEILDERYRFIFDQLE